MGVYLDGGWDDVFCEMDVFKHDGMKFCIFKLQMSIVEMGRIEPS